MSVISRILRKLKKKRVSLIKGNSNLLKYTILEGNGKAIIGDRCAMKNSRLVCYAPCQVIFGNNVSLTHNDIIKGR